MNITYLLGAGASQQCLPIVSEMSKEILDTKTWLYGQVASNPRILYSQALKDILANLESLAEICEPKRNFSIDTYAKKLRISRDVKGYEKLKNTLSIFFTLQQQRNFPDVRYDNFWASILDEKDTLPNNIKILSWNYDSQLEITYKDFIQSNSLKDSANALNLATYKTSEKKYKGIDDFAIFKLNGSATYNSEAMPNNQNYLVDNLRSCSTMQAMENIIDYESNRVVDIENHLSYAWEHDTSSNFFQHIINCVNFTQVLVVIGYSFPFFNRNIDKKILNSMISLEKVYIQDPNASNIKERFLAINNNHPHRNIQLIHDTYQFTLPSEL